MSDTSHHETDDQDGGQDGSNQDSSNQGGSGSDSGSGDSGGDSGSDKGKNWLEWTVTIAGALLVLFVLGFLTYQWVTDDGQPAELSISLGAPAQDGGTVEIPVEVKNDGQKVAEAAVVEVCAGPEACAQLTFDYVPFQSTVTGSVGLEAPLAAPLTTRMVSYRNP